MQHIKTRVFVIMQGQVDMIVSGQVRSLSENQCLLSELAEFSMKLKKGAKRMGFQIIKNRRVSHYAGDNHS